MALPWWMHHTVCSTINIYCLAAKLPRLRLVIDHIAKPLMALGPEAGQRGWAEDMTAAGQHANVFCKLSGMVTEVDPDNHQKEWGPDTFRSQWYCLSDTKHNIFSVGLLCRIV